MLCVVYSSDPLLTCQERLREVVVVREALVGVDEVDEGRVRRVREGGEVRDVREGGRGGEGRDEVGGRRDDHEGRRWRRGSDERPYALVGGEEDVAV